MKRLAKRGALAVFLAQFVALPAAALSVAECDGRATTLRAYSFAVVSTEARIASGDFNNAIVGSTMARCARGNRTSFVVCGVVALRAANGRIENARTFYGIYDAREIDFPHGASRFRLVAIGARADTMCIRDVVNEPRSAR